MNSLDSLQKTKYKWVMDTFLNSQIAHFFKKGKIHFETQQIGKA